MSDEIVTKKTVHSLADLESFATQLAKAGKHESANQAMTLQYLVSTLRANVERDLLMSRMSARFDELEARYNSDAVLHSQAYQALLKEFRELQGMQAQLEAQQLHLAAIIDVGFDQISDVTKKLQQLNAKSEPKP